MSDQAAAADACPTCHHPGRDSKAHPFAWLFRLLNRPIPPASCSGPSEDDATVWGGELCGCRAPFHGS